MRKDIFEAYRNDGWHIFRLIKTRSGDGNAVKGMYKTPKGWNDTAITYDYNPKHVYGGIPPHGMVAIDWDVKNGKKHGDESFERLQADFNIQLETQVKTPSGGGHSYTWLKNMPDDEPKLKKTQEGYEDIEFQSNQSEFVVLGGQTVEGYGEYAFTDEDFEYYVNEPVDLSKLARRALRVQGEGYDNVDVFEHLSVRPDIEEVKKLLSRISPDSDHDGGWQTVAMGLNSWDLNGKVGEELFVNWSLTSKKYVEAEGEEKIREAAIAKYAACVADSQNFFNKLHTLANNASEKTFEERINEAKEMVDLENVAKAIQETRISNVKRETFVERLCEKSKEIGGKAFKVKWKNLVKYVDVEKAKERQEEAETNGLPDFEHTQKGVKYLSTYANLKHFVENMSQHEFVYDIILKRLVINGNYGIKTGEQAIAYSLLSDELVRFRVPVSIMSQHFEAVSFSNTKNVLLEHIESLPEWDGERDFIQEVADTVTTTMTTPEYKRAVMEAFAIQAIAAWDGKERTPHKLSKLDSVMTFVGRQGSGKTTWVGRLMPNAMEAYFKDGVELNPSDKDSYIQAINAGLVELGELDATNRKADISSLKAFLSNTEDEFRAPYGRSVERYKRQTVFAGTVNNTDFLKDATGSRRFLVLDVSELELPSAEIVEGMWAQALQLYLQGKDWRLGKTHDVTREAINNGFTDVGVAGDIAEDFARVCLKSTGHRKKMSITKIISELGAKFNTRERSDFIASLEKQGVSRYSDGKYYLPDNVFTEYRLNSHEEFEKLD